MNLNVDMIEQDIYEDQNEATPLINPNNNLALSTSSVLSSLYRTGRLQLQLASSFEDVNDYENIFSILENDDNIRSIETSNRNMTSQIITSINESNNINLSQSIIATQSQNNNNNNNNNQSSTNIIVDNKIQLAQLQERINKEYPVKFILFYSIILFIFNLSMIIAERTQPDHFGFDNLSVISYRTLDGLILFTSGVNIFYTAMAIFSTFFKRYFLIQLLTILNLIAFFMSFFYLISLNIIVLVFTLLGTNNCDYICIIVRSSMILLGVIISILNIVFFISTQFSFLKNLNKTYP